MNKIKSKVLILHTSVGYGIRVTAENIYEQLRTNEDWEPRIEDLQTVEGGLFTKILEKGYSAIQNRFPFLWGFLYSSKLVLFLILPLRKFIASFKSKKVLKIIREFQPVIVISTQTTGTGIVAYLKSKGLFRAKLIAVFSDYHLHRFWLYDEVDRYFCNIKEQVDELKKLGVSESKIALVGTIVSEKFFKKVDKSEARFTFRLLTTMPVVLLTSGGRVRASTKELFLRLLRSPKTFQVVVVCGHNIRLWHELEKISAPNHHPVKIFGFIENMELLMSASDVLVGKTGGPTMAEAVVKKLPIVITDVNPGHEFINLEYLLKNNIVEHGRFVGEAVFLVEQILAGKIKKDLDQAYNKIIRPPNSVNVVEALTRVI